MDFILIFVAVVLVISVYVDRNTATKVKNGIILGVTLPALKYKDKEVVEIVELYKNELKKITILFAITFLPTILIRKVSFVLLYFALWTVVILYYSNKVLVKYNSILKELKRKNNWFIGSTHLITIDTEVSRMRDKMVVSKFWFIPSILISIITIVLALINNKNLLLVSYTGLIGTIVFIVVYKFYSNKRTEVYSEESTVNIGCNMVYKKGWTAGCIIGATIQSIANLLLYISINSLNQNIITAISPIFISSSIILIGVYLINDRVVKEQNRLIGTSNAPIEVDNDEYWIGDEYNNPNDPRVTVEKRIGYGITYNMGNKRGRSIVYGIYGFTVIVLFIMFIMFFKFDFVKAKLIIDGNRIKIDAPTYGTSFNVSDIEEVKMVDNMEVGFKTNGVGTGEYSLGYYDVKGHGNSLLYIYSKEPPYIEIKLKDRYIFITGSTKEETDNYYNMLTNIDISK